MIFGDRNDTITVHMYNTNLGHQQPSAVNTKVHSYLLFSSVFVCFKRICLRNLETFTFVSQYAKQFSIHLQHSNLKY